MGNGQNSPDPPCPSMLVLLLDRLERQKKLSRLYFIARSKLCILSIDARLCIISRIPLDTLTLKLKQL